MISADNKKTRDSTTTSRVGSVSILFCDLASVYVDTCLHLHANYSQLADKALCRRYVICLFGRKERKKAANQTDNCTIRGPLYIVIAIMNVTSDIIIILIPIPILIKLQVPLHRKLILTAMFSSGIFIMICTVLRVYYSLKSLTTLSIALGWANRECFVAAIVVSLPGIKPLFRNTRWIGSSNRGKSTNPSTKYPPFTSKSSGNTKTYISSLVSGNRSRHMELDEVPTTTTFTDTKRASTASKELILNDDGTRAHEQEEDDSGPYGNGNRPMAIRVTTEYTLEHEGARRQGSFA